MEVAIGASLPAKRYMDVQTRHDAKLHHAELKNSQHLARVYGGTLIPN